MTLAENERELLLNMLEPQIKKFDLEDLISDITIEESSRNERMVRLINTCFSKVKDS